MGRGKQALVDPSNKGMLNVSCFYSVLACNDDIPFPWKSIWQTKVHQRVFFFFFFAWVAVLGKIISMDNLRNQHVIMVD
jgi:hypothetical protein